MPDAVALAMVLSQAFWLKSMKTVLLFLPPGGGSELVATLDLSGQGQGCPPHLIEIPFALQPDIDVDPRSPDVFGHATKTEFVENCFDRERNFPAASKS